MSDFIIRKIPYTFFEQRRRPYLEVLFLFNQLLKSSSKTFALMDTGADSNLIPFSLGNAIGFNPPESSEFKDVGGVGGKISYIERNCRIYIVDSEDKKMYGFDEIVHWAYPNLETQKKLQDLIQEYNNSINLKNQTKEGTELYNHFKSSEEQKALEIKNIMDKFEITSLLGRPFFNNFEFVQFCQKDRQTEDRCFLVYKVMMSKIVEIKDINNGQFEIPELNSGI